MTTYDARPSAFTQLAATSEWEALLSITGKASAVDGSVGSAMVPSLDTGGRNAVIADGNAVIKGMLWRCDAPVSTPIPAAAAQNRIDRLVLQLNRGATTSPTVIQPVVVTGTPAASPVIPALTQTTGGIWQLPISHWTSTSTGALTGLIDDRTLANDSWHNVVGDTGWSALSGYGPLRYRFTSSGEVQFSGATQHANSNAVLAINSANPLPFAYIPVSNKVVSDGNNPLARYAVDYRTDGILYAITNSNTPTATQAIVDKVVPIIGV
jgi:hypothetical protein